MKNTTPMTLGNMRGNSVRTRSTDHMLTLKRASKHRTGGPWSDDDLFDGDRHIGGILWTYAASKDTPWFGRSRRACRNTHMIAVARRAVSRRWRISRGGGAR
jgi:hypothetical protein